jgi:hypothetical protein
MPNAEEKLEREIWSVMWSAFETKYLIHMVPTLDFAFSYHSGVSGMLLTSSLGSCLNVGGRTMS